MQPNGILTITTDFGTMDGYVGTMKGVVLGIAPKATIVDITHDIAPQNIQQAAFMVHTYHSYFPTGTVHLIVVDPGVGSRRRSIALRTPQALFVGPDNGVFTYIWRDAAERWGTDTCTVVELTNSDFWLPDVSSTFHGRDIFAPAAAHILAGVPMEQLGQRLDSLTEAELEQPSIGRRGGLQGRIIHIDYFGNCITNIMLKDVHTAGFGESFILEVIGQRIPGLMRTYADGAVGSLMVILGSSGRLEIAVRNGNAARNLGAGIGDTVRVIENT